MRRPLLALALTAAAGIGLAIAAPVASAQGNVTIDDLAKVDLTVGTAGHVKLNDGGLKLQTDDTTSNAKVAGYITVTATLKQVAGAAEPSMKFNLTPPASTPPGLQVKVTKTNGVSFILAHDAADGPLWWAASCGKGTSSDLCGTLGRPVQGDRYMGTLDEWSATDDTAKVTAVGFTLGSGVKSEGVLKSLSFLDTTYRFAGKPDVTTPPPSGDNPPPSGDNPPPDKDDDNPPAGLPKFATCSEANDAGVYDIPRTSPDYRAEMDSDNDGLACERPTSGDGGSQVPDVPTAVDTGLR